MWDNIDIDRRYMGEFKVKDEVIPGEILYNKKSGVILLILQNQIDRGWKEYGMIKCITGQLYTGNEVTLYNNKCTKNHTQNFKFQRLHFKSEYMIWQENCDANPKYNELVFTVENALKWSGLSQIDTSDFTLVKFNEVNRSNVYNWFGAKITFSTSLHNELFSHPISEVCKIVERVRIKIEVDEKKDINFFIKIRDKIIALISFAIKDNVNIEDQHLYDYDNYHKIGDTIINNKIILFTSEACNQIYNIHHFEYNFFLNQLSNQSGLEEKLDKLTPVLNLYLSLFKYQDMPPEMVFLNIVQALETFHSRFFYDDKKEKYINSVTERFGSFQNFDEIKELLLNDTQMDNNCKYIILVSRLNDLFIGKYDGLFHKFYAVDSGYAQRIADTRHYYTHYGKSKERKALKGDDLIDAIYILRILLEYNVCLELGVDNRVKIFEQLNKYDNCKLIDNIQNNK